MDHNLSSCNSSSDNKTPREFLGTVACVLAGLGAAFVAMVPFVKSWWPNAKTRESRLPVSVDLSHLEPGQRMTVVWQGKPVVIVRRTSAMLKQLNMQTSLLRDPESRTSQQPENARNKYRSIDPEYLVLVGLCTHLGCIPTFSATPNKGDEGWSSGFECPCHGSRFDLAGRVFKHMPAPVNLEVPPYHFSDAHTLVIGDVC